MFFPKDFLETTEGLIFAVVDQGTEQGKALSFLRYVKDNSGWQKVSTDAANAFLKQHFPQYLHYSPVLDAYLHAVEVTRIVKHYQPRQRLQEILQQAQRDAIEQDLFQLCQLLQQGSLDLAETGITGSLLVGLQKHSSDIDLVCYSRTAFNQCRAITRDLIRQGQLRELAEVDWQTSYQRRLCSLSFADYVWHERRKYNKALINGRKFDLNFIDNAPRSERITYQKCGAITLQCKITDDTYTFDYPAEFKINHDHIETIVSFTATYTGQAVAGEMVEVSGMIEQTDQGLKRIVVGSSREAHGEYIRVLGD
ncbi:MAG: hypothetical protein ACXWT3_00160 [Methylococcaceae bacterium]